MKINKIYWITEKGTMQEAEGLQGRGWGLDLASFLHRWKGQGQDPSYNGHAVMESAMEEHMRKMRW